MEITLNALSDKDIQRLIKKLNKLDKNLSEEVNHKIAKVCESLADETEMEYGSLRENELDGNINEDIKVYANENYGQSVNIEAVGVDLYFIEFGTGTMLEKHPSSEWINAIQWVYGGGDKVKYDEFLNVDYWWYNYSTKNGGSKATFKKSIGMNSYPFMFYCSQKLRNKLYSKDTFKGLLKNVWEEL